MRPHPESREPIVVALCVDAAYAAGAAVVVASLAEHTPAGQTLEIWIVHNGLSEAELGRLRRAAAIGSGTLHTYRISDHRLDLPLYSDYISAATFARLYLGDILPARVGRVLYLDCDLLVTGDLRHLWETPLEGYIVAAVPEATVGVVGTPKTYEHPLDPHLDPSAPYFNAGVMVIDLAQWRRQEVGQRAVDYIRNNRPPLMDQDALNAGLVGAWKAVDRMWNVTTFWFRSPSRQERHASLLRRARIVHFVGHRKPWLRPDVWKGPEWHAQLRRLDDGPHPQSVRPALHHRTISVVPLGE
jgi:lipopolysaccharide biosynthesis glycosyltransferase